VTATTTRTRRSVRNRSAATDLTDTTPPSPALVSAPGAPIPPPLGDDLLAVLTRMRLPYLRKAAPEVLAVARAQRWDPAEVLRVLIAEEITGRDAATRRMRRKNAGLPAGKTFESWREADSSIPPGTQSGLASLEWIHRAENLAIAGPSGRG
jgi:DNA replication protein DnaC